MKISKNDAARFIEESGSGPLCLLPEKRFR